MSLQVGGKMESYLCFLLFHKHLWGNSDDLGMAEPAKYTMQSLPVRNLRVIGEEW